MSLLSRYYDSYTMATFSAQNKDELLMTSKPKPKPTYKPTIKINKMKRKSLASSNI